MNIAVTETSCIYPLDFTIWYNQKYFQLSISVTQFLRFFFFLKHGSQFSSTRQ